MGVNGYVITTRAEGTVLTGFGSSSDIFNADHLNHVTHTAPPFINSWEDTLPHMQATTDPNPSSLPAALFEELQRLRFEIARIKQQIAGAATPPFWYTAAASFSNGVQLAPTAARLERTTPALIPDAVVTELLFDTPIYDTDSAHIGGRLTASVDGVYTIGACVAFSAVAHNFLLILRITRGSTNFDIAANQVESGASAINKELTVETVKHLNAGDLVKVMIAQNSGAAQNPVIDASTRPAAWIALNARG